MMLKTQPVIVGEVLFDIFENGQSVLGGAPFNVAWHLQGFGQSPLFISRIGDDELGEKVQQAMREWGMTTQGLQIDKHYPTGQVKVKLQQGQPSFDICNDVAYDHIEDPIELLSDPVSLLYHGSLVARSATGRDRILQLQNLAQTSFVDINLRSPWWNREDIFTLINGASWLKVNDDELVVLTGADNERAALIDAAKSVLQEHRLTTLILTLGAHGAIFITADEVVQSDPVPVMNLQDTVGAGDAFSSICLLGILQNWPASIILNRATEFAARICEQKGGTSINPGLYERFRKQWQLE